MKSKTIFIRGELWTIVLSTKKRKNLGLCDYEKKIIYLKRGQRDMRDTLIHEVIHACLPDLSEDSVFESARAIDLALSAVEDWNLF